VKVIEKGKLELKKFTLTDEDYYAIEIAMNVARGLLKLPDITPEQIIGIGYALYALEQLPMVTEGADCEFGIEYRAGGGEDKEYIRFGVSESYLDISIAGSGWRVEIGGSRNVECDLAEIEESIEEYLNIGAEIVVHNESSIHI